ncbi:hypothetical protein [Roseisolibacter agri]|uniref:Phage virion morphogenesis family protein n=1 Tax=Roseisolibacter agri TaxID=2014610 RepID=A0AA37Q8M9_9BACT|nr:hypothetical protein [Roseisolibacter agri]GLC25066.1 hypothetical protein rosag_15790 [Roseisolibacter agri]
MPELLRLTLRADGIDGIREFALTLRENADDLRPALRVVAENLRRRQRRVFNTEGGETDGGRWSALRPRTITARRNRTGHYAQEPNGERPTRRVLHWTHALRESLVEENAAGSIASVSASTLVYGTMIPYAAAANTRRRFFDFPERFIITDVLQPIQQHLLGRDARLGQGRRTTRRIGATRVPLQAAQAAGGAA